MNITSTSYRRYAAWAFIAYLVFVVYGSLIPFEYRAYTLYQALERFANIAYLNLGVGSRADWIANLVLYIPLAFLGCVWILGLRAVSVAKHLALVLVFTICLTVALTVEFTQIFFAPRTVSINDLVAETLGTLTGIVLWA
ncbi:MAG: VanZ family protein, partial [Gammaproteobacteria bacterium]|nr:VanZ family protein [Gammaproteobacteria bacterium]